MDANLERKIEIHRALYSFIDEKTIERILDKSEELYAELFRLWNIKDEDVKEYRELIKELTLEYILKNTDLGDLEKKIQELTTLLSISETKEQFVEYYQKKYQTPVKIIVFEDIEKNPKSMFTINIERALNFNPKES